MSAVTQVIFATVEKYTCCRDGCGAVFGLEAGFANYRRKDHKTFYCPNGHSQYFSGETEEEKLRKDLAQQKKRTQWAEESRQHAIKREEQAQRKATAYKGVATKIKKRIGNGVCPCCNRTFQNLMAHIKTKHPKFKGK